MSEYMQNACIGDMMFSVDTAARAWRDLLGELTRECQRVEKGGPNYIPEQATVSLHAMARAEVAALNLVERIKIAREKRSKHA